ncbi:hypothetical protein DAEQUDRAFT_733512 [Daedalea quercina L-15889]|uniref:Uncharacterized protein n=1 Tax=Daedalea quercina L-15889 TaxID=1314783 RepID=A0A165KXM7_9APHY|nr:hypothetical protein DAEQUDRAFT_733512 [Daedalea quercina L-15889]
MLFDLRLKAIEPGLMRSGSTRDPGNPNARRSRHAPIPSMSPSDYLDHKFALAKAPTSTTAEAVPLVSRASAVTSHRTQCHPSAASGFTGLHAMHLATPAPGSLPQTGSMSSRSLHRVCPGANSSRKGHSECPPWVRGRREGDRDEPYARGLPNIEARCHDSEHSQPPFPTLHAHR